MAALKVVGVVEVEAVKKLGDEILIREGQLLTRSMMLVSACLL